MNSCVLYAIIVNQAETRYTPDGKQVAQATIEVPGFKESDPSNYLKMVAFGEIAKTLQDYRLGSKIVAEGRLSMNTIERPEGFKEKQAELLLQRIYKLGLGNDLSGDDPDGYDEELIY